ncbi:TetR family transcriptional regulator [Nocardioides sp. GY 10113]|uniref:TetR family transcriptional regulator n=1 Tax=Nocardioides sp. GY 10113 TaxID=2569761 RepID=UPI0010A8B636|nr:TetR family transcriptional regulator [Nocardioides sp. GY 10113]TIC88024.1 TetR family transcriptional regulator [Nocardioides sp. GY 10113]
MRYRRTDLVDRAVEVLDEVGVDALSMRHLAAEVGVQPSALYHHFANKQALLNAVADRILELGRRGTEIVTWESELRLICAELRDAMTTHRDGAVLISRVHALGGGAQEPERRMRDALLRAGADGDLARVGARTLVLFVFGHVGREQARASAAGGDGRDGEKAGGKPGESAGGSPQEAAEQADFAVGLGLVLDGLAGAVERGAAQRSPLGIVDETSERHGGDHG